MNEQQRQKASERARAWNLANPERAKETARRWREMNRDKINAKATEKYRANSAKCREALKQFYAANPWYTHWQGAKQRCNNPNDASYSYYGGRGIKCHLTKEDMAYLWQRDQAHLMEQPSLDKIDSDKDYSRDNCRFMELRENCRKGATIDKYKRRRKALMAALSMEQQQAREAIEQRSEMGLLRNPNER